FKNKLSGSYELQNVIVSPSGGVDNSLFKYKAASGRTVMFAGRMIEEKGPVLAAKAIKRNIEQIDRVIMVGDGPELSRVKQILKGIEVEYHGMLPREELAKKMTEADVFLFPSTREGESLGLVLVEAVFSGCIPLAVLNGAVKEILTNALEVELITTTNRFSVSLGALLAEANNFSQYSAALYKSTEHKYSFEPVAKELVGSLVK
ncbi:MAG: glycosyltransferase family 4 protein, partial [Colwellia sp.]